MGIPNVIIELAENQQGIAEGLGNFGTAINLGWHERVTKEAVADAVKSLLQKDESRLEMARKGQALVDGKGGRRVLNKFRGHPIST
jgi:spore coat polysaccharide biosynthesis predicted glycosyltransferase SpsG